ncbi:hypothetical protein C8R44DRAFT_693598 [Mycena epipterygia]|nr:hypothetical protein C8R44DRAFT_693598 [Mycena epipterygia]
MDSSLLVSAAALGVTNHAYFHRYEPRGANIPFIFLTLQPIALLFLLGGTLSSARLMGSYVVFLLSLVLSIIGYRISPFHSLAHFLGPTINKVSKLWGCWIAYRGYQYLHHKKLHDTYGPYVRTGPNEISVADAAAVSEILNFGGLDKGRFYESGRHSSTPPTIVGLVGEAHAEKRRVWNRAMTSAALREYDSLVAKRATQLVSRLGEQKNGIVDLLW